jgi:hypothetical protein
MRNNDPGSSLDEECTVFCRYLINETPDRYVLNKYREGHEANPALKAPDSDRLEGLLVRIAKKSPFFANLVDAFTSIFSRFSVFRKKLVLLIAILESYGPLHHHFDSADKSGRLPLFMKMVGRGLLFMGALVLSIVIITPLRVMAAASKLPGR